MSNAAFPPGTYPETHKRVERAIHVGDMLIVQHGLYAGQTGEVLRLSDLGAELMIKGVTCYIPYDHLAPKVVLPIAVDPTKNTTVKTAILLLEDLESRMRKSPATYVNAFADDVEVVIGELESLPA